MVRTVLSGTSAEVPTVMTALETEFPRTVSVICADNHINIEIILTRYVSTYSKLAGSAVNVGDSLDRF